MTSGVSRSRSLPFSATAGEAKTSAMAAMQMQRTHSMSLGAIATKRMEARCSSIHHEPLLLEERFGFRRKQILDIDRRHAIGRIRQDRERIDDRRMGQF